MRRARRVDDLRNRRVVRPIGGDGREAYLNELQTSFLLPHKAVDCCRCPGTDHHASPDFQRLIDIGGKLEVDLPPASREAASRGAK